MAAITWPDVVAIASELSGVDPAAQTMILDSVNAYQIPAALDGEAGPRTKLARVLLTAHIATMPGQGASGAAGAITSESVGSISRSYASASSAASGDNLERTAYGSTYGMMIRASAAARLPLVC